MKHNLADVLERASKWSENDQEELVRIADEIEARRSAVYQLGEAELEGIARGEADFRAGRVASSERVAAVLGRKSA
jgi:predicted transcriptional regulator